LNATGIINTSSPKIIARSVRAYNQQPTLRMTTYQRRRKDLVLDYLSKGADILVTLDRISMRSSRELRMHGVTLMSLNHTAIKAMLERREIYSVSTISTALHEIEKYKLKLWI
jgi:hypothetical protein